MSREKVHKIIDDSRDWMIDSLVGMCRIPALHPTSGGSGEGEKAKFIQNLIEEMGLPYVRIDAPDGSVPEGYRPNIVVDLKVDAPKTLWITTHMDVVPAGDRSRWEFDPFEPTIKEGKIIGRGVEDNGQALIASLFAIWAVREAGITLDVNPALAIVADEETGSQKGIAHLLSRGIFHPQDLILVPDRTSPKGSEIEIAEKNILWLKITTTGRQCHGSTPEKGINAHRAAAHLLVEMDEALHEEFPDEDTIFRPPVSTFEPTKKETNVPNVNTVPGIDIFYFDCRILPKYNSSLVLEEVLKLARRAEERWGVKVEVETIQDESSPPSSKDSEIVMRLSNAIRKVSGVEPEIVGIGGGTCSAFFRKAGFDAAVWGTGDETAHSVNEYIHIRNLIQDAKVYATLFTEKL